jgi:membrane-associated phospholipid phosphatase
MMNDECRTEKAPPIISSLFHSPLIIYHFRLSMFISGLRLPAIDRRHKWLAFVAGYGGFCGLYLLTGRMHLGEPMRLPMSVIDRHIPFLSWTIWIYHSQFFFLLISVWMLQQTAIISRTFYAITAASLISFAIFLVYPTTLPRAELIAGGLTTQAFAVLYSIDAPTNCLPSLHVALGWIAALGIGEEKRRGRGLALLWAALISISTLTTKQHYLVDVLAGLCVAALCWMRPAVGEKAKGKLWRVMR